MITVDVETTEQGQPSAIHLYDKNGERQAFNIITAYFCEPIKEPYRGYREIGYKTIGYRYKVRIQNNNIIKTLKLIHNIDTNVWELEELNI